MIRSLISGGTRTILACLLFAGVLDLIAGLLASDARSTQGAVVLLGLAMVVIVGHKQLSR